MSVNTANTPDGGGVLIFNGEAILLFIRDVTLHFERNTNTLLHGKKVGLLYLTSHRIIFLPNNKSDEMKSIEMPFGCLSDVNLEQPIFGANYLRGVLTAAPGSNLAGEIKWSLTFTRGGCIEFGHALLRAVSLAEERRPFNAPPPYAPPTGSFYAAPPAYFEPGAHGATNAFNESRRTFSDRPNNVFMQEAPPPYPGMGAEREPVPTEELVRAGASTAPPPYEAQPGAELRQRRA